MSQGLVLELDRNLLPTPTLVRPPAEESLELVTRAAAAASSAAPSVSAGKTPSRPATLEAVERSHILAVVKQTGGVIEGPKGAARILNLHPNTLRSRMKKLGISRANHEVS